MPVAIGCYGDGAANQGQIWGVDEHGRPVEITHDLLHREQPVRHGHVHLEVVVQQRLLHDGERHSWIKNGALPCENKNSRHRREVCVLPTHRFISTQDGMNVLSVREGMKHVRDYVSQGNGPMVVEMSTA